MYRRLVLAAIALVMLAAASTNVFATSPNTSNGAPERPTKAPVHRDVRATDQFTLVHPPRTAGTQTVNTATGVAPFLTRPYWGARSVNSVFDHCLTGPSYYYVADNKICEVDGTVALKANGVDPSFTLGYAVTPGKTDYLYYDGHNGWDLGLAMYTPVLAAADGTVTYAGWDSYGWGNTVLIDHGNGFKTRYAHLDSVAVTVGQLVSRGQQIGLSGTTGNSTGPHLHFGVYRTDQTLPNGDMIAVDPWGWQATTAADPWPYDEGDLWLTGNPIDPVPDAPTNVTAALQCGGVAVSWTAPAFGGGDGITGYTVTAAPGGATEKVESNRTAVLFPGLTSGTAYTFTVAAASSAGTGPASTATATPVTSPVASALDNSCHLYTMSAYGTVHPAGISPDLPGSPGFGWDIARSFAVLPDGTGGYVVDGWGGLHAFGSAPAVATPFYWAGWDIMRSVALAPWASAANPAGWILDGYGGVHAFGGAPAITGFSYWPGWDIARQLTIDPDSTSSRVAGYTMDAYGGLHAFGGAAKVGNNSTWPGWPIARGVVVLPSSTTAAPAGYTLDGWGGIHPFGKAPAVTGSGYWPGWDIARSLAVWSLSPANQPSGWVLDGFGGLHLFGPAPSVTPAAYAGGSDIFRAISGSGPIAGGNAKRT